MRQARRVSILLKVSISGRSRFAIMASTSPAVSPENCISPFANRSRSAFIAAAAQSPRPASEREHASCFLPPLRYQSQRRGCRRRLRASLKSLEGIFGEPQQGHTRRFTALPVTATWRTMPMVTRYSPRWHANQTRFYFSACEPSPPRPLRRGVRLSQSETWCR